MRSLLVVAALLIGCSSAPPAGSGSRGPDVTETPPTTRDPGATEDRTVPPSTTPEQGSPTSGGALAADGASCLAAEDCASGVCEGEGCGDSKPGKCAPKSRACTRDLRAYCSCEGVTFRTSGSCPGQRFASRTECSTGN